MKVVMSSEHGGNEIPIEYAKKIAIPAAVLNSHRGLDIGSLDLFETLKSLSDFSKSNCVTRLLIEYNRSLTHQNLFSEFAEKLSAKDKNSLIKEYYLAYRQTIDQQINWWQTKHEEVLHLSIHSFTPVFNGVNRNCDVGILYDPTHQKEKEFARLFKKNILKINPELVVRFNYPYLGKADGFTSFLRKKYKTFYTGIEIELNQKYAFDIAIKKLLLEALFETKEEFKNFLENN
jgi:predicted N-formylglutamate amidohydrolase